MRNGLLGFVHDYDIKKGTAAHRKSKNGLENGEETETEKEKAYLWEGWEKTLSCSGSAGRITARSIIVHSGFVGSQCR